MPAESKTALENGRPKPNAGTSVAFFSSGLILAARVVAKRGRTVAGILTIGHSNRSLDDFIALLEAHGVECLVDVRSIPWSRHNPQFNRDTLPASLAAHGIDYHHLAALGGRRQARPDSPNTGWENPSFRGYADYMQTSAFQAGLDELLSLAKPKRVAIMCAEAVPWRCHRSLIGDALLARGMAVEDILSATGRKPHRLTPWARVDGNQVTYPPHADAPSGRR
jgi:uncharacterized protein (DUF488 family)